jgi:Fe-S-cluster containining protein
MPMIPDAALDDLAALYRDLEDRFGAADGCSACGRCCHFEAVDHILYATDLELACLRRGAAASGQRPHALASDRCPFQDASGRCRVHTHRPLGCRLYLCEGEGADPLPGGGVHTASAEALHEQLRAIHRRHDLPWRYRPFLRALAGEQ